MSPTPSAHAGPLRMRLLLLAASGLLPLVIVLAWGIDHLFQERRSAAERSSLELSRALATAIDSELRSIQSLLDQMGTSDELERADLRAFHLTARCNAEQLGGGRWCSPTAMAMSCSAPASRSTTSNA